MAYSLRQNIAGDYRHTLKDGVEEGLNAVPANAQFPEMVDPGVSYPVFPTFHEQFAHLATIRGAVDAIVDSGGAITFAQLESRTNQLARLFQEYDVKSGDYVLISTASPSLLLQSAIAAWKVGAVPMPVSDRMVQAELDAIIRLGNPRIVVDTTSRTVSVPRIASFDRLHEYSSDALPSVVPPHLKVPTSGGSTGLPKLILSGAPGEPASIIQLGQTMGVPTDGICLITAALYHNAPFSDALAALALGNTTVVMERFDPEATLEMIEKHRATWVYFVPTMMQRIWRLPEEVKYKYDLSSVETFFHVAAPCPPWLKREWINWVGAETIYELYGPTEGQAATAITGTEWLDHPGSVGRAVVGEVTVRDEDGKEVAPGVTGEVWLRRGADEPPAYHYVGAESESFDEGWETVGDIGWMDDEGYLYLTDRRSDMLLVGGVNVYPAEIEAVSDMHPTVLSSCVVGLDDPELGKVPAMVIETGDGAIPADFHDFLSAQLSGAKLPRQVVATTQRLRDHAGKMRKRDIKADFFEA